MFDGQEIVGALANRDGLCNGAYNKVFFYKNDMSVGIQVTDAWNMVNYHSTTIVSLSRPSVITMKVTLSLMNSSYNFLLIYI